MSFQEASGWLTSLCIALRAKVDTAIYFPAHLSPEVLNPWAFHRKMGSEQPVFCMNKVINLLPSGSEGRWKALVEHVVSGILRGKGHSKGLVEGILTAEVLSMTLRLLTSDE